MAVVVEKIKWGYSKAADTINRGLININNGINAHQDKIKDAVPVIKLIASLILLTVALSFSKLSFGLTLAFTAVTMVHNLTNLSPLHNGSMVFRNLWYTAFGNPAQNHQAIFALGVVAALVAPAVVVPIIAGSMIGDQLSKAARAV